MKTQLHISDGIKLGSWTVLASLIPSLDGVHGYAQCRCDCGSEHSVRRDQLKSGTSKQCVNCGRLAVTKHGMHESSYYRAYSSMLKRCRDPKHKSYPYYGGRGIAVCERWHDFRNFYADMGPRPPGMTLDRIDPDKGYEPGNCRWATWSVQAYNRRGRASRYRGVSREVNRHGNVRWIAIISVGGKQKKLGRFRSEEQAALAFSAAGGVLT